MPLHWISLNHNNSASKILFILIRGFLKVFWQIMFTNFKTKKLIFKTLLRLPYLFMFIIALIFCFRWSINSTLTATFNFVSLRTLSVANLSSGHDSLLVNKNSGPNHQKLLLTIEFGRHSLVPIVRCHNFLYDINTVLDPNFPFFVIFYPI